MPVEEMELESKLLSILEGTRVSKALIRPYPIATNGTVSYAEFDLNKGKFVLIIDTDCDHNTNIAAHPTTVFLPNIHYPVDSFKVEVTAGSTTYKYNKFLQVLEWNHQVGIGNIKMTVTNVNEGEGESDNYSMNSLNCLTCGYL
ncbi:unnamed protein product [Ambrosiozyma monospora]|uniref:Unnamed protein product n=1 Tax=Ambrosiozyma monospora TaxID=43982 RepID=A0A9W7DJK9_AMBMO|nr:unnamed protein product [Ambrosiozyma monospora]